MKKVLLIIIVVFCFSGFCISGYAQDKIVLVGVSEQSEEIPNPTLKMAIDDALIGALRDMVRGMVSSSIPEEMETILEEEVYGREELFIRSYKIIEKSNDAKGYQVLVEVLVDTKGLRSKLESLGFLRSSDIDITTGLSTLSVIVAGIKNNLDVQAIEDFFNNGKEGIRQADLVEIEPARFTWKVVFNGDSGDLGKRLLYYDFKNFKLILITVADDMIELHLSGL